MQQTNSASPSDCFPPITSYCRVQRFCLSAAAQVTARIRFCRHVKFEETFWDLQINDPKAVAWACQRHSIICVVRFPVPGKQVSRKMRFKLSNREHNSRMCVSATSQPNFSNAPGLMTLPAQWMAPTAVSIGRVIGALKQVETRLYPWDLAILPSTILSRYRITSRDTKN
jgi:hypothetical protein